ncbi:RING finger protein unkempt homolog [Lineus longissimus]|uniref:RING finger protein unkempt homolog n=1 Tax=Lineus longissimus TaxID=88925 RepID=UPI002B4D9B87
MPSESTLLQTPTEKPHHYTYLKEFRTQQCPLFLQHKCTQHRPFTCFHWHFMNQRRRRPIRKRDGTFNYNPDVYCTKYDETSGMCPEGDDCPFLHRTAGDTERRYHLRYYKTGTCVHETDAKGNCVKNGPHCAFAHGAHDLRPPVYDVRELQAMDVNDPNLVKVLAPDPTTPVGTPSSIEKDRILNEDPKWNDTNYVLAYYKTEQCKRPPRLCRQGYACPSYHNSRDRRRSPKKFKYRSTPCPNVKHGDDWGDPGQCESGDNCSYCHTRTEQQFHPEIYKSTKCNDMVQTAYCPRGPFCAFAHVEQEMTTQRELPSSCDNSLAAFLTNALPEAELGTDNTLDGSNHKECENSNNQHQDYSNNDHPFLIPGQLKTSLENFSSNHTIQQNNQWQGQIMASSPSYSNHQPILLPEPIGKGRSNSTSSSSDLGIGQYPKAPGSEREDTQAKLRQQILAIDNDPLLDPTDKAKRKQKLLIYHNLNSSSPLPSSISTTPPTPSSTMSPHAPSFYPAGDTVESVIGNALDDLKLDDFDLSSIDKELERDNDSVCSSYSAGLSASGYLGATSVPVNIPSNMNHVHHTGGSVSSLSQSPPSPFGSLPPAFVPQHIQQQQRQEQQLELAAAAFLSKPNPGKYAVPSYSDMNSTSSSMSPRTSLAQSPLIMSGPFSSAAASNEVQRLREELSSNKAKLASWEEGIAQARSACDAWKKEAEESIRKAKAVEEEKSMIAKQRDEALKEISTLKQDVELVSGSPFLRCLQRTNDIDKLTLGQLKQIQLQLKLDGERIDKLVYELSTMKCVSCQEHNRSVAILPCNHYVLCESCASKRTECPYCHVQIQQRNMMLQPM